MSTYTYTYSDGRAGLYRAGERWYECERCGFSYPESQTTIEPRTGRRVCTTRVNCLDPYTEEETSAAFFFRGD